MQQSAFLWSSKAFPASSINCQAVQSGRYLLRSVLSITFLWVSATLGKHREHRCVDALYLHYVSKAQTARCRTVKFSHFLDWYPENIIFSSIAITVSEPASLSGFPFSAMPSTGLWTCVFWWPRVVVKCTTSFYKTSSPRSSCSQVYFGMFIVPGEHIPQELLTAETS